MIHNCSPDEELPDSNRTVKIVGLNAPTTSILIKFRPLIDLGIVTTLTPAMIMGGKERGKKHERQLGLPVHD